MRYVRPFNFFLTVTLTFTLILVITLLSSDRSHAGGSSNSSSSSSGSDSSRTNQSDWHGLSFKTLDFATAQKHGLLAFEGAVITNVAPAKTPDRSLKPGDGITYALTTKQNKITTARDLAKFLTSLKPGQEISLVRVRKGAASTLVKLRRPKPEPRIVTSKTERDTHLMLDSGGHMALVKDLAFTPDGKQIVSAGDDKVIRVWDRSTGKTVRTIRGDLAPGPSGKIFAMALSPDGKWLAAAGWTGRKSIVPCCGDIRVFEFATGRLVKLLKGHTSIVRGLEFSTSGHRLISGSSDNTAIVWQAPRGRDKSADWSRGRLKVRLKGHSDNIKAVGLLPGGFRAVTGSFDLTLRVWDLTDGTEIARLLGHSSGIQSLAVGPGGELASGDIKGSIRLWSPEAVASAKPGSELTAIIRLNQKDMVGTLKFSPNGKRLLSTCAKNGCKNTQILWETQTGRRVGEFKRHNNVVLAAAWTPDGKQIATAGGTRFPILLWKPDEARIGHKPRTKSKRLVGLGRRAWSVAFSRNGKSIAWGRRWKRSDPVDRGPLQYEMQLPTKDQRLGQPRSLKDATQYVRGRTRKGDYRLRRRKGGKFNYHKHLDIMRGKKRLATITRNSTNGYGHWAYTFTPDGKTLISGGANGALEAYNLAGKRLHRTQAGFVGHEHFVVAVTPSPDGRLLISSGGDQTIRLWNVKTRELIVTLFHGARGEWVMWTPQGYYTGSARGGELVGWQLNSGPEHEAAYVRGQQLRKSLNRPDIIDDAIRLASAKAAIRKAGLASITAASLLAAPPPVIRVYAQPTAYGGRGKIIVHGVGNQAPITKLNVYVANEKGEETQVNAAPAPLPADADKPPEGGYFQAFEISLFGGENRVRVVAVNAGGDSEPATVTIQHNGEGNLDQRETLWILAIGVNAYPGAKEIFEVSTGNTLQYRDLRFAGKDAATFAATAARTMGRSHRKVEARLLVGPQIRVEVPGNVKRSKPTRSNILAALRELSSKTSPNDTVVVFLAGHGENWSGGRYHFLPTDFFRRDTRIKGRNVIDWADDVMPVFSRVKGRRLLFLDACNAAASRNRTLLGDANASRFTAFQAASSDQQAWEFAREGHGAFTYVLIQGLKGVTEARDPARRAVTVYSLGPYVKRVVERRTQGAQTPEFAPQGDFVLAR